MSLTELGIAALIAVGLVGILVPLLPGSVLVLAAILLWALDTTGGVAWTVFAVAATFLALGAIAKYVVPGRRLSGAGVPMSTQWTGAALAVVGFFVVPVVGLVLGFVLGVYLAERRRVGPAAAGGTTWAALRAVGLSLLIELGAALLATTTWVVGVMVT